MLLIAKIVSVLQEKFSVFRLTTNVFLNKKMVKSFMSSFACGISGDPCKRPYITPSGGVYEKTNIERWISENGTDPKTDRALSKQEIIELKQAPTTRPHAPQAMTIPAIIKTLRYLVSLIF